MEDLFEATIRRCSSGCATASTSSTSRRSWASHGSLAVADAGRMPLYCSAIGKALLAYSDPEVVEEVIEAGLRPRTPYTIVSPQMLRESLAEVARTGIAYDREEAALGLCCTAAPVFGPCHALIGALSISGSTGRLQPQQVASAVKTAASPSPACSRAGELVLTGISDRRGSEQSSTERQHITPPRGRRGRHISASRCVRQDPGGRSTLRSGGAAQPGQRPRTAWGYR